MCKDTSNSKEQLEAEKIIDEYLESNGFHTREDRIGELERLLGLE